MQTGILMEREVTERFARIEAVLQSTVNELAVFQQTMTQTIGTVMQSQMRLQELLGTVTETMGRYVDASDARMKRIEENLDILIRAITAEHGNGRRQQ
jgi:hypothetical protein